MYMCADNLMIKLIKNKQTPPNKHHQTNSLLISIDIHRIQNDCPIVMVKSINPMRYLNVISRLTQPCLKNTCTFHYILVYIDQSNDQN